MRQYRHKGCTTPMYTYVGYGDGPLRGGIPRSSDWLLMGEKIPAGSYMATICPDCRQRVSLGNIQTFEALDGKPFFGTWDHSTTPVIPTKPTLWQRIKELFTRG